MRFDNCYMTLLYLLPDFSSKIKREDCLYNCYLYRTNGDYDYEMTPLPKFYSPQILHYPKVEFCFWVSFNSCYYPLCWHAMCGSACMCPLPAGLWARTASDTPFWHRGGRQEPWWLASVWLNCKQLPVFLLFFSLSWLVYWLKKDFRV